MGGEARWDNWAGNVTCAPRELLTPTREAEVVEAVARAGERGEAIRVAGAGHSFTPLVATDGLVLDLSALSGIARVEVAEQRAWVRAGTRLHDLGEALHEHGLAMQNLGDIDVQALGGAIGTGTHGTGRTLRNLSSRVLAMRVVGADGELRVVRADDPALAALRVSIGALGVATAFQLDLVPAYRLHERVRRMPLAEALEGLEEGIGSHRHFEFFWYPTLDRTEVKTLDPTDREPDPLEGLRGERIDWSHRVLPSVRDQRFVEMEYSVPAAAGREVLDAVCARMRTHHPEVAWPVEYRTLRADDAWLSTAHGRETVTISLHQDVSLPWRDFFADLQPLFVEAGGRPHWGKWHDLGAEQLAGAYPRFDEFVALRDAWDPERRFGNPHLRHLFGE